MPGCRLEKRSELGIEFDAASLISDGRNLIVSATKDALFAGCFIANYTYQEGVFRRPFEWQKRFDRGFDVLT